MKELLEGTDESRNISGGLYTQQIVLRNHTFIQIIISICSLVQVFAENKIQIFLKTHISINNRIIVVIIKYLNKIFGHEKTTITRILFDRSKNIFIKNKKLY